MGTKPDIRPIVGLQLASQDIWDKKYRLRSNAGEAIDKSVEDTLERVATALAEGEHESVRKHWRERFLWALQMGAVPAGRITANAGAGAHKPKVSTINCTVSDTVRDSMEDILERAKSAGMTLKAGAGIGYCFSTLRPKGAAVAGAGASTSGPLPFMEVFDRVCQTVASAGGRRGAQMGTFDVGHPDVEAFIRAKRTDGALRQFNLSLLVTEEFIRAVEEDRDWQLAFPLMAGERNSADIDDTAQVVWRDWEVIEPGYTVRDDGKVACRVYRTIKARKLWSLIMASTYDYAEPGFILIDRVNQMNNNWWCEDIRATNP